MTYFKEKKPMMLLNKHGKVIYQKEIVAYEWITNNKIELFISFDEEGNINKEDFIIILIPKNIILMINETLN